MTTSQQLDTIFIEADPVDLKQELRDALTGVQKSIPSKWLYDAAGSELFEQICELPEYYLTRSETEILRQQSADIIQLCPKPLSLIELGSGSSTKTRLLIEAILAQQPRLTYCPIDISPDALEQAAPPLLDDFDNLRVVCLVSEFAGGLNYLTEHPGEPRLVAFLGSTIGNLTDNEEHAFFTMIRSNLRQQDRFLLGFDLLKDPAILIPAYNDAQGVTAEFNLNLLNRLNQEFGADFDLRQFEHLAIFNEAEHRIEMHLVSRRKQAVSIPGLDLTLSFEEGEHILTEKSNKQSLDDMKSMLQEHDFETAATFTDSKDYFCLILAK